MTGETIGDVGEFGLIGRITDGLSMPPGVSVGPGDDCAVFSPSGDVAVSTDTMIENVHFRRAWSGPHDVGRKAVASAVADLEAVGAKPGGVVVSLSAPPETPAEWVAGSPPASGRSAITRRRCSRRHKRRRPDRYRRHRVRRHGGRPRSSDPSASR